jgi:hypothetical protein
MKFSKGRDGKTRTSELALLTSCTPSDTFEEESREMKMRRALLAFRRFPTNK